MFLLYISVIFARYFLEKYASSVSSNASSATSCIISCVMFWRQSFGIILKFWTFIINAARKCLQAKSKSLKASAFFPFNLPPTSSNIKTRRIMNFLLYLSTKSASISPSFFTSLRACAIMSANSSTVLIMSKLTSLLSYVSFSIS